LIRYNLKKCRRVFSLSTHIPTILYGSVVSMRIPTIFSEALSLSMRIPTIFSEALSLALYSISSIYIIDSYLKRGENSFQQERAGLEVIKRVIKYILGGKRQRLYFCFILITWGKIARRE